MKLFRSCLGGKGVEKICDCPNSINFFNEKFVTRKSHFWYNVIYEKPLKNDVQRNLGSEDA